MFVLTVLAFSGAESFREGPLPVIAGPVDRLWHVEGIHDCRHVSDCVRCSTQKYKSQGLLVCEVEEVPDDP